MELFLLFLIKLILLICVLVGGRHQDMITNAHIKIGSNSYEKVKTFKYLGSLLTNQNSIQDEIKCRLKAGNSCYYLVQTLLSSRFSLRI